MVGNTYVQKIMFGKIAGSRYNLSTDNSRGNSVSANQPEETYGLFQNRVIAI